MPKKKSTKRVSKTPKKQKLSITRRWFLIAISVLVVSFLIGIMQTQAFYFFITGKEQFSADDPTKRVGYFHGQAILVPPPLAHELTQQVEKHVLGDTSNKRIEVDLTNQRVYAFENNQKVYEFIVSTGKWGATPRGEFVIERRVPVQTMSGGSKALGTYYYLPGVRNVQFFGNKQIPWWVGYSFHSTYWHNNFGHPMSHGCINMTLADSQTLWNWTANVGTKVVVYGVTPAS